MTADTLGAEPRAFVLLKSRRRLDLLNPDPHAWTDDDLAAGLSRTMRRGGASRWEHPLSVAQHSLTVLTIREADGALTPGEALRELLHDATEFMLGWDCITPLKAQLGEPFRALDARLQSAIDMRYRLPKWTPAPAAYAIHKRADRLAAASEAFHVVGWSRIDMRKILRIAEVPLLQDPLSPCGFAPWEPWPPRVVDRLFFERFKALERAHQSAPINPRFQSPSPTSAPFPLLMEPNTMSNPDDDPPFDIDPDGDAAAYEEWAALAGEPARPAPDDPQRVFPDHRAAFDAIASSLTEAQIKAASHHGSILVLAGAGTGKTSTLTAAVAHRIASTNSRPIAFWP